MQHSPRRLALIPLEGIGKAVLRGVVHLDPTCGLLTTSAMLGSGWGLLIMPFLKVGGIYRLASVHGRARYITDRILHDHCSRLMIYEAYIGASDAKWGA
jgi:hypothetical protein